MTRHLLALTIVCFGQVASAEIMVGESLEWLVDSSPHVAVYRVQKVNKSNNGIERYELSLQQVSRKKGKVTGDTLAASIESWKAHQSAPTVGNELLLFLDQNLQIRYLINLAKPPKTGFTSIAFDKHFHLLTKSKDILELVDKRIQSANGQDRKRSVQLEIPFQSTAHAAIWAGSSSFLMVPADAEVHQRLLKMIKSTDTWVRAEGARCLAAYPTDQTVTILEKLLKDPGTQEGRDSEQRKFVYYPVRDTARASLERISRSRSTQP